VRIGTWNLECVCFKDRNAARLKFLRERDADIWVLTETHEEIDLSSTHSHAARSLPRPRTRNGMHWVDIWSRYPVIAAIEMSDVRTAAVLLDTPVGPLIVFGTVWPWHSDTGEYPGDPAWKNWARQAPVIELQAEQWAQLRAAHSKALLCVAGDLNMTFGGPNAYSSREGRIEAALAMQTNDLVCTTAWALLPPGALQYGPIDHILLSSETARSTGVVETWAGKPRDPERLSDHSGLIVEVVV
jgi:hypothetical protein